MPATSADHMHDIDKKLAELPPVPSECCIFRVHDSLRNENKEAYEPAVVAIGPYHHGKDNLQPMEEHKLRYLQQLLERRNEISAERYIMAMRESEQRACKFYAEPISLDSNAFVEMMVLDSCFIVELLRKHMMRKLRDPNDRIFLVDQIVGGAYRDLMLFENQLPFFIVMQFFNMTKYSSDSLDDLIGMFVSFFVWKTQGEFLEPPFLNRREDDIEHLLGMLHYCCCNEFHSMASEWIINETNDLSLKSTKELQEAGIKFEKIVGRNLFDIRYVHGTMEIPTLIIDHDTESFFRNLIAYEKYHPHTSWNHFTAYHKFMDYLVNTSEDVEILTHHGIICNLLGDNAVVATMLNKLGSNVVASYVGYEEVYNNVNEHCRGKWNLWLTMERCRRKWNLWLAILRRDYFNSPWALISFLAAAALLLLTLLQTIFTIHPFGKSN